MYGRLSTLDTNSKQTDTLHYQWLFTHECPDKMITNREPTGILRIFVSGEHQRQAPQTAMDSHQHEPALGADLLFPNLLAIADEHNGKASTMMASCSACWWLEWRGTSRPGALLLELNVGAQFKFQVSTFC